MTAIAALVGCRVPQRVLVLAAGGEEPAPELTVPLRQVSGLRYGENPHQAAAFYTDLSLAEVGRGGIAGAIQHHGKEVR